MLQQRLCIDPAACFRCIIVWCCASENLSCVKAPQQSSWRENASFRKMGKQNGCKCECACLSQHADFAGCLFADLQAENVAWISPNTTMSMKECSILYNNIKDLGGALGVIAVKAFDSTDDVSYDAELKLEGCTFQGNIPSTVPVLVADNRGTEYKAVVYSDSAVPAVCTYEGALSSDVTLQCENSSPEPLENADNNFLTASRIQEVRQVRCARTVGCFAN
jgi:hypothetical protein